VLQRVRAGGFPSVAEAAQLLVQHNFTYFFDLNATRASAKWLRSVFLLYSEDASGENVWEQGSAPVPWLKSGPVGLTGGLYPG
jgi:hypothetical protein